MKHTSNHDCRHIDNIVHREGKALKESTPQGAMHDSSSFWHRGDLLQSAIEIEFELCSEAWLPHFIPSKSLRDVCGGIGPELNSGRHYLLRSCSLARTSSQLWLGPGTGSSSRRSSSALCQSGIGTSSGVAARLSQISSTSLRRSEAGSRRISSRRVLGVMRAIWPESRAPRNGVRGGPTPCR